ncbi:tetratricopeptide repeat protein [Desulfovibrio inopinatus]|uniref:tetratricopeptide repeat protein n=1 Tax=Desulfovibrio inopinatus TaxID=102109 RepID=UPI000413DFED|nr:tetratricopeptide repeat protein [Desulfovibrio inopinatus]
MGACAKSMFGKLNRLAMQALNNGKHDEAMNFLELALDKAQQANAGVFEIKLRNNLGLAHTLAGNKAKARREFEKAMELHNRHLTMKTPLIDSIQANLDRLDGRSPRVSRERLATKKPRTVVKKNQSGCTTSCSSCKSRCHGIGDRVAA